MNYKIPIVYSCWPSVRPSLLTSYWNGPSSYPGMPEVGLTKSVESLRDDEDIIDTNTE